MTDRLRFFAPCPRGTESLLADELRGLRARSVRPFRSGVAFAGPLAMGLRACLWSRVASRVLLELAEIPAATSDELYAGVHEIAWEDHMSVDGTLAVDATGTNEGLRDTRFIAVRVKDAIADRFRERTERRPSVDTNDPDLRINVALRSNKAVISIDLSGEPLHRRGYRERGIQTVAPLKENLAAAIVLLSGWQAVAETGGGFCDPLCGSGTLAIEAALAAGDVAPGLLRARWGFDRWLGTDSESWGALLDEADSRAEEGRGALPPVSASDEDPRAVEIATSCAKRAGLGGLITIEQRSLASVAPPAGVQHGLVCCNPPYGERMGDRDSLAELYGDLEGAARGPFSAWEIAVFSSDEALSGALGLNEKSAHQLFNGALPTTLRVFAPAATGSREPKPLPPSPAMRHAAVEAVDASEFANRLGKRAKHLGKWARRSGVSCYRLYDADLPDYSLAIDVYAGGAEDAGGRWVHVAEYAPPAEIDPALAEARLSAAVDAIPGVLDVAPADVFVKRRERKRGSTQYELFSEEHAVHLVGEGGLVFEVNLSDYIDTGLFLDGRPLRAMVRQLAEGKRFLNLFGYTGTASVCAAAGGATSTCTVDLSATYLDWAERNMLRNGFSGPAHQRDRADVLEWLGTAPAHSARYELIYCDPPTFSASKRMEGTFDVQRDHVRLITGAAELLSDRGEMLFSCNRRGFALGEAALAAAGLVAVDITASTIPEDFERNKKIHAAWKVTRA